MNHAPEHSPQRRRWWGGHHPLVWWITVAAATFGLAYSIIGPFYRAPDEQKHVDMIKHYGESRGYPDPRIRAAFDPGVWASGRLVLPARDPELGGARPPQSEDEAEPRQLRPTFKELATSQDPTGVPRRNQLTQHPPLHYVLASSFGSFVGASVPEEAWTWDREVWLYRLFSVFLVAPLPLLAATAARAIGVSSQGSVLAAAAMLLIPMRSYIGAAVNNDASMMLGAAIAVTAGLAHLKRPNWQSAAVASGGAAVAAWSKSTGASLVPWVLLVVLVAAIPDLRKARHRDALIRLGTAFTVSVLGAGWYLTNLVRFRDPQPSSFTRRSVEGAETPLWLFLQTGFERVAGTFWGQPGRRAGVTLAAWLVASLTVAVVLASIALMVVVFRRRRRRILVGLLVGLWIVQAGLLFSNTFEHYLRTGKYVAMQGRYLYAALVPFAVLVALFSDEVLPERMRSWAVANAIAGGAALHLVLAGSMLAGFWAGDGVVGRVDAVLAWSPLPAVVGALVLGLPPVVTGLMALAVVRTSLGESRLASVLVGGSTRMGSAVGRQAAVAVGAMLIAVLVLIAAV